jgi:drug/metabolite transporter (DMT)-like permease
MADLYASLRMIAAFAVFSDKFAVPQVILIRQVMALILMAPRFWAARAVILHPTRLPLHPTRGLLAVGAMVCGLTSITYIPLANATAISMAEVPIATAFAATLLRESIGWRRRSGLRAWLSRSAHLRGL